MTASNNSVSRIRFARLASARAKIQAAHRGNHPAVAPEPKCYTVSHFGGRGQPLPFDDFDEAYVQRLRQGDFRTEQHFSNYFGGLLQLKLRSRLRSPQDVEDAQQETLRRVLAALRDDKLRQPDRLGAFVFGICRRVVQEDRIKGREVPMEDGEYRDFPDVKISVVDLMVSNQTKEKVREILNQMQERDRRLLRDIFLEERDKDEVCRDFGVTRGYLRVLLLRARQSFKSLYLRDSQDRKGPLKKD